MGQVWSILQQRRARAIVLLSLIALLWSQRHKTLGLVLFSIFTILRVLLRRSLGLKLVESWEAKVEIATAIIRHTVTYLDFKDIRYIQALKAKAPLLNGQSLKITPLKTDTFSGYWIGEHNFTDQDTTVLVYFHGGAYTIGCALENKQSYKMINDAMSSIGRKSVVFSLEYSLAPEHPYPKGLNECVSAVVYLQNDLKISPTRLFIGGDSAGGGLAIGTALKLRINGLQQPAGLVLLSPLPSLGDYPSTESNLKYDIVSTTFGQRALKGYLKDTNQITDEFVEPVKANLAGLPHAIVFNGGKEILHDAISEFVAKYNADNNDDERCREVVFQDMFHEWMLFPDIVPNDAKEAYGILASFMKQHSRF